VEKFAGIFDFSIYRKLGGKNKKKRQSLMPAGIFLYAEVSVFKQD